MSTNFAERIYSSDRYEVFRYSDVGISITTFTTDPSREVFLRTDDEVAEFETAFDGFEEQAGGDDMYVAYVDEYLSQYFI